MDQPDRSVQVVPRRAPLLVPRPPGPEEEKQLCQGCQDRPVGAGRRKYCSESCYEEGRRARSKQWKRDLRKEIGSKGYSEKYDRRTAEEKREYNRNYQREWRRKNPEKARRLTRECVRRHRAKNRKSKDRQ